MTDEQMVTQTQYRIYAERVAQLEARLQQALIDLRKLELQVAALQAGRAQGDRFAPVEVDDPVSLED